MGIFRSDPQPVQLTPHVPAAALTTGSQPPRTAVAGAIALGCVLAAWPAQGEPPLNQQNRNPRQIAPLTLVYGQQPPRIDALPRVQANTVRISWPEANEPRLQFNNQNPERRYIAPLTLVYGQQPSVTGAFTPPDLSVVRASWPELNEPRLQFNNQNPERRYIVAHTLTYGQQPPIVGPLPRVQGQTVRLAWPEDKEPRLQFRLQQPERQRYIAPLTLVFGQQPPIANPPNLSVRSWDSPQQIAPYRGTAAWNVVVLQGSVPFSMAPWSVVQSWRTTDPDIQYSGSFAPVSLGDQPQVSGPITPQEMALVRLAWEPARPEPPAPTKVVTLALASGEMPPFVGALSVTQRLITRAETLWWPAQSETDNAGWNFQPIISQPIPFRAQLHIVRFSWEPPFVYPASEPDNAAWNFIALTVDRAIAQSAGTDSIVASLSSITGVLSNTGTDSLHSSDSKTSSINSSQSAVSSIDPSE